MESDRLLVKLLNQYRENFDITENYIIGDHMYSALAEFNATSARYVLVKRAELWSAHCYEYILFDAVEYLDMETFNGVINDVVSHMEPQLVRKGNKFPEPNHMYSYMTIIIISDNGVSEQVVRKLKKIKMYTNYLFSIRGYSQLRLVAIDLRDGQIITNKAAHSFQKEIKKLF